MKFWKQTSPPSSPFVIQHHKGFGLSRSTASDPIDVFRPSSAHGPQGRILHSALSHRRLNLGILIATVLFSVLVVRAAYVQTYEGARYHDLADANRYRITRIVPPRGEIHDRHGVILARNIPSFLLTMTMQDLPRDPIKREWEFFRIMELTALQRADIDLRMTEFARRPSEEVPLLRNIPYETAMRLAIAVKEFPGFTLRASTQREYPSTALSLSHVLGYTGKISAEEFETLVQKKYRPVDVIGKNGVEKMAEESLRGTPGEMMVEVDARGETLSVISKKDPLQGQDITLGIDVGFQKYLENRMQETLTRVQATRGSIIALDPQSGLVRALVSLPSFDANAFASGIDDETYQSLLTHPDKPLYFRSIAGEYPSGSLFKPFVAYAALREGIVNEHTSFLSSGGLRIGEWFFPDWKAGGHGVTDVRKAIAESVNTYFYIIGGGFDHVTGLGVERISSYAKKFGFGDKTGIDISGESDGFLPSKGWKEEVKGERWYVGDTYHFAIGQGDFLTTPIQIASATAAIANGGFRITPRVIDGGETKKERLDGLDERALQIVREGMRQGVTQGSSRRLLDLPYSAAGKTGTAQSGTEKPTHSWFTGFAPFEDPSLVITVLVEEGGESTAAAVPLAHEAFLWWFKNGNR